MCEYCDVRMPDASGLEMDGKHGMMRILIADGGYISVRADKLPIPSVRDTFRFNYCPMCGKKLGESDDENVRWIIPSDYEMHLFSNEVDAIERCEDLLDNEYETVDLYRVRIESRKRCQMVTVWD